MGDGREPRGCGRGEHAGLRWPLVCRAARCQDQCWQKSKGGEDQTIGQNTPTWGTSQLQPRHKGTCTRRCVFVDLGEHCPSLQRRCQNSVFTVRASGAGTCRARTPQPLPTPRHCFSQEQRKERGGEACSRGRFFKESSARPAALLAAMQPSPSTCPGAFNEQLLCLGHPPTPRSLSPKHATWQEAQISAYEETLQHSPCSTKL